MIVFPPSSEAGHLNLDERTAPLFTLTLLTPSKRSEERMKVQLNLSTKANLGTEERGRHKVVAFYREVTQESLYGFFVRRDKKKWPLQRGGRCGVGFGQSLFFFLSLSSETRETGK